MHGLTYAPVGVRFVIYSLVVVQVLKKRPHNVLLLLWMFIWVPLMLSETSSGHTLNQTTDEWTVALDENYPPHEYWEDGVAKGFNPEIVEAVAERMGKSIVWVPLPWTDAYDALLNGTVESLVMARSDEREQFFDFSNPILNLTLRVFVRDESSGFASIQDLANRTVAVQETDIAQEMLIQLVPEARIVSVPSQEDAILLVASGDVTAAFCNEYAGVYAATRNGVQNLKMIGNPIDIDPRVIAVEKGNMELLSEINNALDDVVTSGDYDEIHSRWLGQALPTPVFNRTAVQQITILVGGIGVAVLIVAGWSWTLRRKVKSTRGKLTLLMDLFRHDLRNIGQITLNTLQILKQQQDLGNRSRYLVDTALDAVQRAETLTSDIQILEYLTGETHELSPVNTRNVLEEAITRCEETVTEANIVIDAPNEYKAKTVSRDLLIDAFSRVVCFLVDLSVKADEEPNIDIHLLQIGDSVVVRIGNHGPGVSDEQKDVLLRRYQGLEFASVGLDLSVVHAVIVASKGAVKIEDRVLGNPDAGAVFHINLGKRVRSNKAMA